MKVAIDISNIYHRSYAIVSGYNGFDIEQLKWQQVLGRKFITDLASLANKFDASQLIFAFDAKPYFRSKIRNDYKGHRKRKKQAFYDVINELYEILKNKGFNTVKIPGLEADDILALYGEQKDFTVLISNDKDVRQCASDKTVIFTANSRNSKIFTANKIAASNYLGNEFINIMTEIDPKFLLFEKVFLGDEGDNIKRLLPRGNGPKKVKQIYKAFLGTQSTDDIMKSFNFEISSDEILEQISMIALGSMYIPRELLKEWRIAEKQFTNKVKLTIKDVLSNTKFLNE